MVSIEDQLKDKFSINDEIKIVDGSFPINIMKRRNTIEISDSIDLSTNSNSINENIINMIKIDHCINDQCINDSKEGEN